MLIPTVPIKGNPGSGVTEDQFTLFVYNSTDPAVTVTTSPAGINSSAAFVSAHFTTGVSVAVHATGTNNWTVDEQSVEAVAGTVVVVMNSDVAVELTTPA